MLDKLFSFLQYCFQLGFFNQAILKKIRRFGYKLAGLGTERELKKYYAAIEVGNIEEAKHWIDIVIKRFDKKDPMIAQALGVLNIRIRELELKYFSGDGKFTTIDMNNPDFEPTELML